MKQFRGFRRCLVRLSIGLTTAAFFATVALAQFNSSIEGTVRDESQAGVPQAAVIIVDQATQVTQRTTTSESGFFRVAALPPGSYRVEVSCHGFKTWAQTDLVLRGSEAGTVYPVLAVGQQAVRVEVTATANAVETSASKVSRAVEEMTIAEVPMMGAMFMRRLLH